MEITSFECFGLPATLQRALKHLSFATPTPIQAQAIPVALQGKDVLGTAQTGTGKTGAFMIPLLSQLLQGKHQGAVILAPTRELATQIDRFAQKLLGKQGEIKSVLLIGGTAMGPQLNQLRRVPQLIIGTPGRINDHLERKSLRLGAMSCLVLDEMDRMLDMGFSPQIATIAAQLPSQRQTLMFSATFPQSIMRLANTYLKTPTRIAIDQVQKPGANIQQIGLEVARTQKYAALCEELNHRKGLTVIFVKTKRSAEGLTKKLIADKHRAAYLHGGLTQRRRDKVVHLFRQQQVRVLIATDVAARGLDIPGIAHVINFDLPQSVDDYIHRIGRTGRNEATGHAVTFFEPEASREWQLIQYTLDPENYPKPLPARSGRRPHTRHRSSQRRRR